jgi:protein-tyrosine phosphatase
MSYVDLHLHLLPGVDDGARNLRQSIEFSRRLAADGVREATVTPHVGTGLAYDPLSIPDRVASLQAALDREGVPLRLHGGGEIHPHGAGRLSDAELAVVAHGPTGARWVLCEVPFAGIDDDYLHTCRDLRRRGYGVLIGHPERAAGLVPEGLQMLRGELAAGSLLQVNVCSLIGNNGPAAREAAHLLVRSGLAFVLASDAHPGTREHTLRSGFDLAIEAGATPLRAWRLTQGNPRFLLENGIPPSPGWPAASDGPALRRTGAESRPDTRLTSGA